MKISVIIPTRNNAAQLVRWVPRVLHQTIPPDDFEVVVVDNGSTDDTPQVLAQMSSKAKNFQWVTEPTPGRALARNRGIREALGELIVFLDDDIEVQPDYLERHLTHHAEAPGRSAVIARVVDVSPIRPAWLGDYFRARQVAGSSGLNVTHSQIQLGLHFATGNASLLRSTLECIRIGSDSLPIYFDPSFKVREDGDVGCRLIKAGVQFILADDILCYHHHPRTLQSILLRSYEAGYSLVRLLENHPEARAGARNVTPSPLVNLLLLTACIELFVPAYLLRTVWPEPMRKVAGGLLMYQANRGYQRALRESRRLTK